MPRPKIYSSEAVHVAIADLINLRGSPPTCEELRKHLKMGSTRTVFRYLKELETQGKILRWPGSRGMSLLKAPKGWSLIGPPPKKVLMKSISRLGVYACSFCGALVAPGYAMKHREWHQ